MDDSFLDHFVRDLEMGDSGYTVPWAMTVDHERRCWLDLGFTTRSAPRGTACMRVERRADGFHVDLVGVPDTESWTASAQRRDAVPVRGIHGGAAQRNLMPATTGTHTRTPEALSRAASLFGVEQYLSLGFKRKAKDKDWPVIEMTRAVAEALDKDGWDAPWEKVRERLISSAPLGTLKGGVPVPPPDLGARYRLLAALRTALIAVLLLAGGMGLVYVVSGIATAALDALLAQSPWPNEATLSVVRERMVELASGWGISEAALPYTAAAPLAAWAVPKPAQPAPPAPVPDARWKELLVAVRAHRDAGTPPTLAEVGSPRAGTPAFAKASFPHQHYNKPTLFRVRRIVKVTASHLGTIDAPVVDLLSMDSATRSFEETRDVALMRGPLAESIADTYARTGESVVVGYPTTKPTRNGVDRGYLMPLDETNAKYGVQETADALLQAATYLYDWWGSVEESGAAPSRDTDRGSSSSLQRIDDARAALKSLDEQWLDFTTDTTPDGLRAYYFEMPALWRRPAAPAVAAYETALFELRELVEALPLEVSAADAERASNAAEGALTAWSEAQQYAISVGVDDGRSVEEKTAARRLPELLNQFLDPSITAAQASRLRTLIEAQMHKLTTRPGAAHLDAVNAGALRLHRAPVLAAIER